MVELNRAVAHGRAHGANAGLAVLDATGTEFAAASHLVASVPGDLLQRLGRFDDAAVCFDDAATKTVNMQERALLKGRADACGELDRPKGRRDITGPFAGPRAPRRMLS